jgi:hypothetical protein
MLIAFNNLSIMSEVANDNWKLFIRHFFAHNDAQMILYVQWLLLYTDDYGFYNCWRFHLFVLNMSFNLVCDCFCYKCELYLCSIVWTSTEVILISIYIIFMVFRYYRNWYRMIERRTRVTLTTSCLDLPLLLWLGGIISMRMLLINSLQKMVCYFLSPICQWSFISYKIFLIHEYYNYYQFPS